MQSSNIRLDSFIILISNDESVKTRNSQFPFKRCLAIVEDGVASLVVSRWIWPCGGEF